MSEEPKPASEEVERAAEDITWAASLLVERDEKPYPARLLEHAALLRRLSAESVATSEPDEDERDAGANFVLDHLAKALGLERWTVQDGSETWDGDVSATLWHILYDAKVIDTNTNLRVATSADGTHHHVGDQHKMVLKPASEEVERIVAALEECKRDNASGNEFERQITEQLDKAIALLRRLSAESVVMATFAETRKRALGEAQDEITRLCGELAEAKFVATPAASAWRPIETAPKDGTRVLLAKYVGHPSHPTALWWAVVGFWSAKWSNWNDGIEPSGLAGPTHWQPLPPPPASEPAAKQKEDPTP